MAEFISKYSSIDFDKAMDGGFKFANGEFLSEAQKQAFILAGNLATKDELGGNIDAYTKAEIDEMLGAYINEVAELLGGEA